MSITKRAKIIFAGLALTGAVVATGGAFTAGGLTDTSTDGFVGGNVAQTITGAAVTNVAYGLDAGADNILTVDVTTKPAQTVSIGFTGGTTSTATFACVENLGTPGLYECTIDSAVGTAQSVNATSLSIKIV